MLTQDEAKRLLEMLKNTLEKLVQFPRSGEKTEFQVMGDTPRDIFTLHIYRGTKNNKKYDFGARIKICDKPLLELHINPGAAHRNPDGTKITGPHWHIYTEEHGRDIAFPAEDIQSDKFIENTILFLEKFNVVKKPDIQMQLELKG